MKNKLFCVILAAACILTSMPVNAQINYLPGVRAEMTNASYWSKKQSDSDKILLTYKQIEQFNKKIQKADGTYICDLKKYPQTFDGIALSNSLYEGAGREIAGFIGEKYDASGNITEADYYEGIPENCIDPDAAELQSIRYAVVTNRTCLLAYPTDKAILDDPGDDDFDNRFLTGLRVNEPLIIKAVSADKEYCYAESICCPGWVPVKDIAICSDRNEWLGAWDFPAKDSLVVYGSRTSTEASLTNPEVSSRRLTMGTTLKLKKKNKRSESVINRSTYNNYVVYLPVRNDEGKYEKKLALISQRKCVSEGYLPLTKENISRVAFSRLGDVYGWGGMLLSQDCSGYVRDVYKCFGLEIARNTSWQTAMPLKKFDVSGYTTAKKEKLLDKLPLGSVLFFPGHEMLYLGSVNGRYYVIDSVSSIMQPNSDKVQRVRSVIINPLDIKRRNGEFWIESLTTMLVPFEK